MRIFYRDRDDFAAMNSVRKRLFERVIKEHRYPTTTGLVSGGDPGGPALEFEVMFGPGKTLRDSPQVWKQIGGGHGRPPAAHAVEWDGVLWISGQIAYDVETNLVGERAADQVPQAMANLRAIVADAEFAPAGFLAITIFLVAGALDEADQVIGAVLAELGGDLGDNPPVISVVGVEELFMPGLLVEIEALAARVGKSTIQSESQSVATPNAAARCGRYVFAVAESPSPRIQGWGEVIDELERMLVGQGAALADLGRLTVWVDPSIPREGLGRAVEADRGGRLPDDLAIGLIPSRAAGPASVGLRVEALAYGEDRRRAG
ncbi:MAG: RidA family protein [Actinomycetota bacterium]